MNYTVIPDRVEVATLLIAAGMTHGDITVTDANPKHLESLLTVLKESGLDIDTNKNTIRCRAINGVHPVDVTTEPYPGFPTDMQAQVMSLLTLANGKSIIKENIFENRYIHVHELVRMGASISVDKTHAIVKGVPKLSGAEVKITDLRAGAALVLAGLIAEGETTVYGLKHLNRGYYNLAGKLQSLGAVIRT